MGQSWKPWSHTLTDWDHGDDKEEHVCVCVSAVGEKEAAGFTRI